MSRTRARITEEADSLIYRQGFAPTSFGDIADSLGISRGNFYHHFKTKDAILDAVIHRRLSVTQALLTRWETESPDPAGRIGHFIDILLTNQSKILQDGCPAGTLCSELAKLDHLLLDRAAEVLALFRNWLSVQFAALGCAEPDALALHLLGRSQGIAVLLHCTRDATFLGREVATLHRWLGSLAPPTKEDPACSSSP